MRLLTVRHVTTYSYSEPVRFGEHRMMFRPRASHDLRLLDSQLDIRPQPLELRWLHDVFDNSVAIASFDTAATELRFDSTVTLEHIETPRPDYMLEAAARTFPFAYSDDERPYLTGALARNYPADDLASWTARFLANGQSTTMGLLLAMTRGIKDECRYLRRVEKGVQSPGETLRRRSGSCRDFAVLMMEAVRSLGLAARFVSGYIFVPDTRPRRGRRRRGHARVDAGLSAWSRLGGLRSHQRHRRQPQPHSRGRRLGPAQRAAALGHLRWSAVVRPPHGRDRERERERGRCVSPSLRRRP